MLIRPGAMQLTVTPSAATCIGKALDQLMINAEHGRTLRDNHVASHQGRTLITPGNR